MASIKLLNKYIAKEVAVPFLFGVVAFSTITAGGALIPGLVSDASTYNLNITKIMALFILRMPKIISYTFPMASLLAALLSFGRLSGDSEITAFKSGGLSLYRLMLAPLLIGLAISVMTIWFNESIVPQASFIEENTIIQLKDSSKSAPDVKKNVNIPKYENGYLKRLIYASRMIGSVMKEVSVSEYEKGRLARIIFADEAEWQTGDGWEFRNGTMHQFGSSRRKAYVIEFEKEVINVNVKPRDISGRTKDADQMNLWELSSHIEKQKGFGADVTELRVKWHQKIAVPFACFIFILLGAPMGIRPQRSSSSVGLGLSILIVFLYYLLLSVGMWVGLLGVLNPLLAAWLPNILIGIYGVYSLQQKSNS
ncbi:LptF/LptG family permease [bacterium]|nr:LptF/LptG family permease [bacterium]